MGLGEVTMGGNGFMNLAVPKVQPGPGQPGQPGRANGASNGIKPNANANASANVNANAHANANSSTNANTNINAGISAGAGVSATPKLEMDRVAATRTTPPQSARDADVEKTASRENESGRADTGSTSPGGTILGDTSATK
jgi:hypothetical protein